ncbi:MAG: phosphoribosyl-ATP diphosphatase [Oscillospiraceae bacterium]|jgi:phosphoribosyl-ATP pyrophosphohydrolase|nr:phosphoribosyl-ATP diphosphatase [Oscillospiraceae bacterium]
MTDNKESIIQELYDVIMDRRANPAEGSYTNYLFSKGLGKICKKFGEEAIEVVISSLNGEKKDIVYEIADLQYHLMVLMAEKSITPDDIYDELRSRR